MAGPLYENNNLIFYLEIESPLEIRSSLRKFYLMIDKADTEKVKFLALQHAHVTRLLKSNEHLKILQELLGHAE